MVAVTYCPWRTARVWRAARRVVLSEEEAQIPLAERPYAARAAGVSLWIESGVAPAEVALRAGHSIAVLFRFYVKAIHRNQQRPNEQIEQTARRACEPCQIRSMPGP